MYICVQAHYFKRRTRFIFKKPPLDSHCCECEEFKAVQFKAHGLSNDIHKTSQNHI